MNYQVKIFPSGILKIELLGFYGNNYCCCVFNINVSQSRKTADQEIPHVPGLTGQF